MKVQITEAMVQTMSGLIECGLGASKVISAKMQASSNELYLALGQSVEKAFNEVGR